MHSVIQKLVLGLLLLVTSHAASAEDAQEKLWQSVYNARAKFYEQRFGKLPDDILKIGHMSGVWPGGGLYVVPAKKIGKDIWVYTTFGFTNPDMPTTVTVKDVKVTRDAQGRVTSNEMQLTKKEMVRSAGGRPGYGYEIVVVAKENAEWPLWFLQWAANAEILKDADILSRVEKYNGLTIEQIRVGENQSINVLITKAQAPLPAEFKLPNGTMIFLVATTITEEEMRWSMKNGRDALLQKLQQAGVGQISVPGRPSVIQ